jgi:hypothetical protein
MAAGVSSGFREIDDIVALVEPEAAQLTASVAPARRRKILLDW